MATQIIMPRLGESVVDGTVAEWLKEIGDTVEEYEPIVRVSTDKVDTEIPAPAEGVLLAISVNEGETVDAGTVLGMIGAAGEKVTEQATAAAAGATQSANGTGDSSHEPEPQTVRAKNGVAREGIGHVTPVVARMAAEHDLDLSRITGTGRNGRITKKDVMAYMENAPEEETAEEIPPWEQPVDGDLFKPTVEYDFDDEDEPTTQAKPAKSEPAKPASTSSPTPTEIPGELTPLTSMRRSIAEHMVRSKHTSPHATVVFEVDLSNVVAHRAAHKQDFGKKGVRLTYTPYFVMATAKALLEHSLVNARWTDEGIYRHSVANVGMAVAIDNGLVVPVIKNAQDYNLMGLARIVDDLANRARKSQLSPDDMTGGTFTITNHGVSGSIVGSPIINQPQAAIMGIGALEKRVKVINDAIAIRPCAYISLTFDHRIIDGATADQFMNTVKQLLESWKA